MNRRQCVGLAPAAALGLAVPRWSAELGQALAARPDAWFARVTGAPSGKERCSSTAYIGWCYGGWQWLEEESVPDFLLLARERKVDGWFAHRGYLDNGRIRFDRRFRTLRETRAYAASLTGGLLAPWIAVPRHISAADDARDRLVAYAKAQIVSKT